MYLVRQDWANSADSGQMPCNAASDQGQHCFATYQSILITSTGSNIDLFKFLDEYSKELGFPII